MHKMNYIFFLRGVEHKWRERDLPEGHHPHRELGVEAQENKEEVFQPEEEWEGKVVGLEGEEATIEKEYSVVASTPLAKPLAAPKSYNAKKRKVSSAELSSPSQQGIPQYNGGGDCSFDSTISQPPENFTMFLDLQN